MTKLNSDHPSNTDGHSAFTSISAAKDSINRILSSLETAPLTLKEYEELMSFVKDAQQRVSNQEDSLLISLHKLRSLLSVKITSGRKLKGYKTVKMNEGDTYMLGNKTFVIKDGGVILKQSKTDGNG
jgi:hypothetical protein